jgi:hypothetical protein
MKKSRPASAARLYTPRATLCALGVKVRSLKLFDAIAEHVRIRQKTIRHTPMEKLTDAFIAILAGAHGLVEVNTRVRSDVALQRAFGRAGCAEQSVVQETLDLCTSENVRQIEGAVDAIFRAHSGAYRHDYKRGLLLLDVDLTGLPCGKSAEESRKGYLSGYGVRRGRQMGRVMVELDEAKRRRTVLRIDAGGGSMNGINWLLKRGYHVHCKDFSSKRAAHLVALLRTLAHNVVVWAKRWLAEDAPKLKRYGVQRMVRDVLAVSGFLELGKGERVKRVVLNSGSALGRACAKALRLLLEAEHVRVTSGET